MNHIFFCLDENYIKYVSLVLKSFIKYHDLNKYQINFIVYNIQDHKALEDIIKNVSQNINYSIKDFIPSDEFKKLLIEYHKKYVNNKSGIFSNFANWSRFYITDLYPEIEKGLYLDLDILFRGNIDDIFRIDLKHKPIAVISYDYLKIKKSIEYRNNEIKEKFEKEFNIKYDKINNNYNCGVIYYNLSKLKNISNLIENILKYQINNEKICKIGTEPLHNILFNDYVKLDKKYNCIPKYKENNIMKGIIIHFKGEHAYEKIIKFS